MGKPVGNHSGLWELGAAPFVIPPALRDELGLTKITGLDYNMFVSANLTKAQALAILKYTLDQRLASNRAPLFVGGHTAIYTSDVNVPNTTPQQRREVIEEFVNYALGKSQVRIVTGKNVITWMRNPVALGGSCSPESNCAVLRPPGQELRQRERHRQLRRLPHRAAPAAPAAPPRPAAAAAPPTCAARRAAAAAPSSTPASTPRATPTALPIWTTPSAPASPPTPPAPR